MIATYLAMFLGLVVGAIFGGTAGGALGAMLGGALGMMWTGAGNAVRRTGALVVREELHVLCIPKGQVATATFLRDAGTGRWADVERCTLCSPEDQVLCNKRCLVLVRDALPRRRHPVRPTTAAPTA